jgi:hypothetical protein
MKYGLAPRSVGMRDRSGGKQLKVYHKRQNGHLCLHQKKLCGIVFTGFVGDFALEIHSLLTIRCNKKSMGGGGTFPQRYLLLIYNI